MQFVLYPKHQYRCPHVSHCPHLGGAALGSVVLSANTNDEWPQSLWRQIDALRAKDTAKYHEIDTRP